MKKCGVLVLLLGAVLSGVEGLRMKTVKKEPEERLFRTTTKESEELVDFDKMPDNANLDFFQDGEKAEEGAFSCGPSTLAGVTAQQWKAYNYDGAKTPSNYCHAHASGGKSWFCWQSSCKDTSSESICNGLTNNAQTFPNTDDGWRWDELPYDENFKCPERQDSKKYSNQTYKDNKCEGPVPSDSCTSNTAYCWEKKCIDIMEDPKVCNYAPHGTTNGKNTDDGWDWQDLNYDIRAGCFTQEVNPVVEAFTPSDIIADTKGAGEPFRQLFMQRYLIWCEFADWKNNKQKRIAGGRTYGKPTNLACQVGRAKFDTPR